MRPLFFFKGAFNDFAGWMCVRACRRARARVCKMGCARAARASASSVCKNLMRVICFKEAEGAIILSQNDPAAVIMSKSGDAPRLPPRPRPHSNI